MNINPLKPSFTGYLNQDIYNEGVGLGLSCKLSHLFYIPSFFSVILISTLGILNREESNSWQKQLPAQRIHRKRKYKGNVNQESTHRSVCSFEEIAVYTKPDGYKPKIRPLFSEKMVPQNTLFSDKRLENLLSVKINDTG